MDLTDLHSVIEALNLLPCEYVGTMLSEFNICLYVSRNPHQIQMAGLLVFCMPG